MRHYVFFIANKRILKKFILNSYYTFSQETMIVNNSNQEPLELFYRFTTNPNDLGIPFGDHSRELLRKNNISVVEYKQQDYHPIYPKPQIGKKFLYYIVRNEGL